MSRVVDTHSIHGRREHTDLTHRSRTAACAFLLMFGRLWQLIVTNIFFTLVVWTIDRQTRDKRGGMLFALHLLLALVLAVGVSIVSYVALQIESPNPFWVFLAIMGCVRGSFIMSSRPNLGYKRASSMLSADVTTWTGTCSCTKHSGLRGCAAGHVDTACPREACIASTSINNEWTRTG